MSERIVDNPANHGWVEENGKWVWEGGATTGHIEDGTIDGQITTWDVAKTEWTPDSAITVEGGNVSVGTNHFGKFNVGDSDGGAFEFYPNAGSAWGGGVLEYINRSDYAVNPSLTLKLAGSGGGSFKVNIAQNDRLTIDSSGNATFSGEVFVEGGFVERKNHAGLHFTTNAVWPAKDSTTPSGLIDLGSSSFRFKTIYGTVGRLGTVITDTGVAISTRDLIETLATLRNATKDETTLEGLRDAIGNAVGGLIEKFEAMQNEAVTQDIQESPVTQEISNED